MKASSVPVIRINSSWSAAFASTFTACHQQSYQLDVLWNDTHPLTSGGGCQGDGPKPTEQDPVRGLHPPPAVWLPVPPCVQHSPLGDTARPLHEASGEQGPVPGPLHDLPGVLHHEAQQYHWDDGEQGFYFVLPEVIMVHHEVQQYHQDNGKQRFCFVLPAQQYHWDDGKQSFYFVIPEAIMVHSPWSSTALMKWW